MNGSAIKNNHDLLILGSGSTAFAAALHAQYYNARVLMVEKSVLGGTCINWGCIPSKTMIHAALFNYATLLGQKVGLATESKGVDYLRLCKHRDQVVTDLRQERYLNVLKRVPALELIKGTARFLDPHTIEVEDRCYRADRILVAVGGVPSIIPIPGLEKTDFLTSRGALLMKSLPQSLVIIGGGVIAVELGQMFHRLGCRVTILEHGPRILPAVERELSEALEAVLRAEGLKIFTKVTVCSVDKVGNLSAVNADIDGHRHEFTAEKLLLAVGTAPATLGIGLDRALVTLDQKGFIVVDNWMRTSTPGIWAAGDVVGGMMIATVGAHEGVVAVDDMFNPGCACPKDSLQVPMAIFTDPEIGLVGHTEESARQAGFSVVVNTIPVSAIPKAHVTGHTAGVIKMVADQTTGRLLGVHLASHRGADLINEAALALRLRATVDDLAATQHVYPSIGEGLRLCAQGFSRDLSRMSCCAE